MNTFPLKSLTIDEAKEKQFALVNEITKVFSGRDVLSRGDLGVVMGLNQPITTHKVEQVLANFFNVDSVMLVRGSGTMAIRMAIHSFFDKPGTILVHDASIYPTTKTTLNMLQLNIITANFNNRKELQDVLTNNNIDAALIQVTRQKPDDSYSLNQVIDDISIYSPNTKIVTDDNYSALKTAKIGVELGADISCFSTFKLLGPEGIGCIAGKKIYIDKLRSENYSGGLQVQGHEAMDVLRGMIYAPVALAISATVVEDVCERLNNHEINGVSEAYIANAQSKVLIVTLEKDNAELVLKEAEKLGAAPNPVGAESKYEFVPMFYRVSGTFRAMDPIKSKRQIRINPMRCGAETVMRILHESIKNAN